MENLWTILISAILSGVVATIITLWWQNRSEKIKTRKELFITLMSYRFKISHLESVKAINCVQAVFYDCPKVLSAWRSFKEVADKKPFDGEGIIDAYIKLLEEIAEVLNYKNLNWKDMKTFYYPEALAQELDANNHN